tara:strand:- start:273 stop:1148 length:876 start_codon:yes stop_codon:yes gene_type:complete
MSDAPAPSSGPAVVVGALGMLGKAWRELLLRRDIEHTGLDLPTLDITDPQSIAEHIGKDTRLVVNCAAYTDVDGAEDQENTAHRLNADAVGYLADHCKTIGATLIHYSTDYVFDGKADTPYKTDQARDPLNAYGRTKAAGELRVESSGCDYLTIRTSWLYAPWARNFVATMVRLSRERDELQVVDDQRGRPTSAQHLALASLTLLEKGERGTFHVTDGGECTWFDFACEIKRLAGNTCDIKPCSSDQYKLPAARPAYSVMDLSKTEAALGPMPDWKNNLADVIGQMEPQSV